MTIQKLAENTIESLADNRQSIQEFLAALIAEARSQAQRAAKEADDYTTEELEYWAQVAQYTRPTVTAAVRDFLWALDRGYFHDQETLTRSAFVTALRRDDQMAESEAVSDAAAARQPDGPWHDRSEEQE